MTSLLLLGVLGLAAVALAWWLLVITEGVYLGRVVVVWLYDLYARRYDRIKRFDRQDEAFFLGQRVLRALNGVRAPLVLDVATGTGRLPQALMETPTFNGKVCGLDLSRRMLGVAAAKLAGYGDRTRLLWQEAERLPFPDGAFDLVACVEALEFFEDQLVVLAEIVRVLRPGGVLLSTRRRSRDAFLMPGKALREEALAALLSGLGMEAVEFWPWQVDYNMLWARKPGAPTAARGNARPLVEVLHCPQCGAAAMIEGADGLRCGQCGARYPIAADGVIELHRRR
jgi:ubiquinone/menaquinone biosynthesis C-methylase UbiE/ribosomal protein S27AE